MADKRDFYGARWAERQPDEIKKAYRRLARQYHRMPTRAIRMLSSAEINEAYQILGDEETGPVMIGRACS